MPHVDPVCGMPVAEEQAVRLEHETERLWFCSEFCRQQFLRHARAYEAEPRGAPQPVDFPSRRVAYLSMEVALSNDMPTWIRVMRRCIALSASFFNTHRVPSRARVMMPT
jgi:YHS domain-containing protein